MLGLQQTGLACSPVWSQTLLSSACIIIEMTFFSRMKAGCMKAENRCPVHYSHCLTVVCLHVPSIFFLVESYAGIGFYWVDLHITGFQLNCFMLATHVIQQLHICRRLQLTSNPPPSKNAERIFFLINQRRVHIWALGEVSAVQYAK